MELPSSTLSLSMTPCQFSFLLLSLFLSFSPLNHSHRPITHMSRKRKHARWAIHFSFQYHHYCNYYHHHYFHEHSYFFVARPRAPLRFSAIHITHGYPTSAVVERENSTTAVTLLVLYHRRWWWWAHHWSQWCLMLLMMSSCCLHQHHHHHQQQQHHFKQTHPSTSF